MGDYNLVIVGDPWKEIVQKVNMFVKDVRTTV